MFFFVWGAVAVSMWSIETVVNRDGGQSGRWSIVTVVNRDRGQYYRGQSGWWSIETWSIATWSIGTVVNINVAKRVPPGPCCYFSLSSMISQIPPPSILYSYISMGAHKDTCLT